MKNVNIATAPKKNKSKSEFKVIVKRFCKNRLAVFGVTIFIIMALLVIFADLYMNYETDALEMNMSQQYASPSWEHPFGCDKMGRDYFARVIYGGRISMSVGLATVSLALLVGGTIGAVAAYFGGTLDNILMRIMDIFLAIPATLMALTIIATLGSSSIGTLVLALGVAQTPRMARIVRSAVIGIKDSDYIEAARACGTGNARIILRHIIPNAIGPILVQATQTMARSVLIIASLSFIGLGISEPTPEWGSMLSSVKTQMRYYPHLAIFPGIAMGLTVLSLTLIGDGLRDAMDPRLRN